MFWIVLFSILILVLAFFIHKGIQGTPFRGGGLCTPNINHLRRLENRALAEKSGKKENLWQQP